MLVKLPITYRKERIFNEVGDMFKKERKWIENLSKRTKCRLIGAIIIFLSIFIADSSITFFLFIYLLSVIIIFSSAFIGIEEITINAIAEIITTIGFVLFLLGVFAPLGMNPDFYYVQIAGTIVMLIGTLLERPEKKKDS